MAEDAREKTIPLVLIGLAIVILGGRAVLLPGMETAEFLLVFGFGMGLMVLIGILACFISAAVLNVSFGELGPATLKLAGMLSFTYAASSRIVGGFIVAGILLVIFLVWLFDLEPGEAIITTVILWLTQLIVSGLIIAALASAV
jgi:hypothetical protein